MHRVCNGLVQVIPHQANEQYCDYCRFNLVIPDLSVDGNLDKWRRLENAKHRVLYILDEIGLPFRDTADQAAPNLRFRFLADGEESVQTGHNNGVITINIREADSVERERTRVAFDEPQRTLVGHFRHELGHYLWDRLVRGQRDEEYRAIFGDERDPSYGDALERYYAKGPKQDWQASYISAYASMHSWEDFAETCGAYLDMVSVITTAEHFGIVKQNLGEFDSMVTDYQRIGLIANELNRDMGLPDLVPEVFVHALIEKLRFVHSLRQTDLTRDPSHVGTMATT